MGRRTPKPFNNPFVQAAESLKKEIKRAHRDQKRAKVEALRAPRPGKPSAREASAPPELSAADRELFLSAVAEPAPPDPNTVRHTSADFLAAVRDAKPLARDPRGVLQPELPPGHARHVPVYDEDAEALAQLEALVDGITHFDIADSDEFVEGLAEGVDRRLLTKMKRGDFAVQGHLDLHGLRRDDAREAVARFIEKACKSGHRCVRIVHGRGLNSKDNIPILKLLLTSWLERGRVGRAVLAFCTARPNDGGAGAVYVLLRR